MASVPEVRVDRTLLRSLRVFSEDRLRFLDAAAAAGPVAALRFGRATVLVVSEPEIARTTLVTEAASWTRPPAMRLPVRMGVGENIFTQADAKWAAAQPLVAPAFRGRALATRLERLEEILDSELAEVARGPELDLSLVMGRIALVVSGWVFLGERLAGDHAQELADHQRHVVDWVGRRLGALAAGTPIAFGSDAREMRAHRRVLEHFMDGVMDRAERRDDQDTVLGMLRSARVSGRALDRGAVRSHLLGLLLAGNETTAAALSWILVHGAENPELWTALRHHPERADAFVTETLRINPPAWGLTRTPTRPNVSLTGGGQSIRVRRPGVVTVYIRGMNRDAAMWPDPERFDPERHSSEHRSRSLIPFGLGPRGCIGQQLALAELRALTPALARHGDVVISSAVVEDASFSLRPKGGLRGQFIPPGQVDARRP